MRSTRRLVGPAAAVLIVGAVAAWWLLSLTPSSYSVTSMGHGHSGGAHGAHPGAPHPDRPRISVEDLRTDRAATPDVRVQLTAQTGLITLAGGQQVSGYLVNGTSPGPTIEAVAGQLVEVVLRNADVAGGVTLHWHGMDVPNAEDGVAGITQDAVPPGGEHTYRWRIPHGGTYWYHSHQVSHEQVIGGLLGAVVIHDRGPSDNVDVTALLHTYAGRRTIAGQVGETQREAAPGRRVRVRLINTDNGATTAWVAGASYRVVAVDGNPVHDPGLVGGQGVEVPAGGRIDLEVATPPDGALRVQVPGASLVIGPSGASAPEDRPPSARVDLLGYGTPADLGGRDRTPDRVFDYTIGRRFGIADGRVGLQWTMNGKLFPNVPMFPVARGDVVRMRLSNTSGDAHPMHLHGHHVLVLSRDGVAATGSPWLVDSLTVEDGQRYEVAFIADNPGIWTDHCHNLRHAAEGLMAHVMYEGIDTPFRLGRATANHPD